MEARFSREFLLTLLTIYWATQTITPSMRDYLDNRFHGAPLGARDFVRVPTAVAVFAHEHVPEGEPPHNVATLIAGVVEHGTYHGGQIALLKKALAALDAAQ